MFINNRKKTSKFKSSINITLVLLHCYKDHLCKLGNTVTPEPCETWHESSSNQCFFAIFKLLPVVYEGALG